MKTIYVARMSNENTNIYEVFEDKKEAIEKANQYNKRLDNQSKRHITVSVETFCIDCKYEGTPYDMLREALINKPNLFPNVYEIIR